MPLLDCLRNPAGSPWRRCLYQPTKLAFIASTTQPQLKPSPQFLKVSHSFFNWLLSLFLYNWSTELNTDTWIEISNMKYVYVSMWFPFASKAIYTYYFVFCLFVFVVIVYFIIWSIDSETQTSLFPFGLCSVCLTPWVGARWGLPACIV